METREQEESLSIIDYLIAKHPTSLGHMSYSLITGTNPYSWTITDPRGMVFLASSVCEGSRIKSTG